MPKELKTVACLLLVLGGFSLADTISETFRGLFMLDMRVLLLFAGWGLFRKKEFWRKFAFICSLSVFIYSLISLTLLILYWLNCINVFSIFPNIWTIVLIFLSLGIGGWVSYVLSKINIQQFFLSQELQS